MVQVPVQTYSPSVSPFVKLQGKSILKNTRGVGVVAMGRGNGRRKEEGWERVGAPLKVESFCQNHIPPSFQPVPSLTPSFLVHEPRVFGRYLSPRAFSD